MLKKAIIPVLAVLAGCSPVHITPMDVQLAVERAVQNAQIDDGYAVARCAPIVAFQDLGLEDNGLDNVIVRFGSLDPKEPSNDQKLFRFKLSKVSNTSQTDWILIHYPREVLLNLPCEQVKVEAMAQDVSAYAHVQ